jgi:hypothetical protein
VTLAVPPSVADVRAWLAVSPAAIDDAQLQAILDGETTAQARACTVDPFTADHNLALLRRCGRAVAARGVPLGLAGSADSEFGPVRLPSFDAEIERYEGPTRKFVFG